MKKFLCLAAGFLFAFPVWAQPASPLVEVSTSLGLKPTQRVFPGTKGVEVLRFTLQPRGHSEEGTQLTGITVRYEGDERDQFVRYHLVQNTKTIDKVSLVSSDDIAFTDFELWLPDDKVTELRVLADVAFGDIRGDHIFSLAGKEALTMPEEEVFTATTGNFPIRANRVIIAPSFETPSEECNLREEPVCGVDGRTYFNFCIAFHKNIEIDHEGPCLYSAERNLVCTQDYQPVCGEDGRTYTNQCFLNQKEGVFKRHDGSCFPKNYVRPSTFPRAVKLYDLKQHELEQLRPRISQAGADRMREISFVLHQYNFTAQPRLDATEAIAQFLQFTQTLSDRIRLEQEIEVLNAAIIEARLDSAREKYRRGDIPFLDVDEEAWFFGPVQFLKKKGWTTGYLDGEGEQTGLYEPEEYVTKAEITKLLFDAAGIEYDSTLGLPDNSRGQDHWARDVIVLAEEYELSLWQDQPNPDQRADRWEVVQLIFEVFGINKPVRMSRSSFSDIDVDETEGIVVQHAKNIGLISGYPDGTFRPRASIVRGEVAKIVQNAYEFFGTND